MASTKKLLVECTVTECGHFFQAWTETRPDGTWELHFHCECNSCEAIATEIAKRVGPNVQTRRVD